MANAYHKPITVLFTDLISQVTGLVRKEGQLARAEISENISRASHGLMFIVAGAVLIMPALVILLVAAGEGLEQAGLAPHWAALIVGGLTLLIGLILLMSGANRLKVESLMPSRTIEQLQRDASVAIHQVRQDHEIQRAA